jgi:hypothetical protein
MTAPSKLAIFAAERRLQQARRDTYDSVSRLRTAIKLRLRRPSTIAWAAALGGTIAFTLLHRRKTRRVRADRATAGSAGAIVSAFLGTARGGIVTHAISYLDRVPFAALSAS